MVNIKEENRNLKREEKPSEITDRQWLYVRGKRPNMTNNTSSKSVNVINFELQKKKIFKEDYPNYEVYKDILEVIGGNSTNIDGIYFKKINETWYYSKNVRLQGVEKGGGKWLIFANKSEIDYTWAKIKQAVKDGKLGSDAKVSTAKSSRIAMNSDTKVICVYTDDEDDYSDIQRIRKELRKLGITWKIPYKTNKTTIEGRYQVKGHKKISKYFE